MKKQIRFIRPNPQTLLYDIFLRGSKTDKTMLIMIDSYFEGHPDHIRPDKLIPKTFKDGLASIEKSYEIVKNTLKQLKTTNWTFFVHTDIGNKKFIKILKKFSKNEVKNLNFKIDPNKVRSLIAFTSNKPNKIIEKTINQFVSIGKPVCVIDKWGVKRYPRSD